MCDVSRTFYYNPSISGLMGSRITDGFWSSQRIGGFNVPPRIGSYFMVGPKEALLAPPKDTFWRKVSGFGGQRVFQLTDLKPFTDTRRTPLGGRNPLKEGDVIGLQEHGLRPILPEGLVYEAIEQPAAKRGDKAADMYIVRADAYAYAFATVPVNNPPLQAAKAIPMFPDIPVELPTRTPGEFPTMPAYAAVGRGGKIFGADVRSGQLMVAGA